MNNKDLILENIEKNGYAIVSFVDAGSSFRGLETFATASPSYIVLPTENGILSLSDDNAVRVQDQCVDIIKTLGYREVQKVHNHD